MKKIMIKSTLGFIVLAGNFAFGQSKQLTCTGGEPFELFSATLDESHYDPGSGYFDVTNASFVDNYLTLDKLTCEGYELAIIDCVGFAYGTTARIDEVSLFEKNGQFFATLGTLKGSPQPMHNGPWPCTVQ